MLVVLLAQVSWQLAAHAAPASALTLIPDDVDVVADPGPFLAGGVANFLGTHWPVGDEAALAFSRTLYAALLAGDPLGDAVLAARRRIAALPSLDWADYVHYGNPEFRLVTR